MYFILLTLGLLILVKGADIMVDGASKIARIFKVPAFIVGLFIVAIGTSAPEISIGILTGIQGTNLLTLGDVLGSNIANIALIMGITTMTIPITIDSLVARRMIPVSFFVQLALLVFLLTGNILSQVEGMILIFGMLLFLGYLVNKLRSIIKKEKPESDFEEDVFEYLEDEKKLAGLYPRGRKKDLPVSILKIILGLAGLVIGTNLSVNNGVLLAQLIGVSEEVIGMTVIAIGTSLPELVTCLMAIFKHEDDMAVGNIVGSNIINILLVLGITSTITPISIDLSIIFDVLLMLSFTLFLLVPTLRKGILSRRWGFLMIFLYIIFIAFKFSGMM